MEIEKVGDVHVGYAERVEVGVDTAAILALGVVVDFYALDLKLVSIVLVFPVERGVRVDSVDCLDVLGDQGKDLFLCLGVVTLL